MAQFGKVGFIGIGAQKSATSWLHHVLSALPEIVGSGPKELNYFTANYDRGDVCYENQFAAAPDNFIRGECSSTYFFSGDAVERAYRYNPVFRIIVVLRDPVERGFSNHLHELRKGHIPEGLSERRHESIAIRSEGLRHKRRAAGDMARSVGKDAAVDRVKRTQPERGLLALNNRALRQSVEPMLPETQQRLSMLFSEDVSYVAELMGRKELPWAISGNKERAENAC